MRNTGLVVATVMSNVTEPVLHPRYLVGSLPGLALAASIGLVALRHWALPAILGGALLLTGSSDGSRPTRPAKGGLPLGRGQSRSARAGERRAGGRPPLLAPTPRVLPSARGHPRPSPSADLSPRAVGNLPTPRGQHLNKPDIVARFDRIWLVGPSVAPWIGNVEGIVTASHHLVAETHFERVLVRRYQVGEHSAPS